MMTMMIMTKERQPSSLESSKKGSGCYIITMNDNDYDDDDKG